MTDSTPVHGAATEVHGVIVGVDLDASGFDADEYDTENPESMPFTLVLEVADISSNRLSYLPVKGSTTITSRESEATGVVPIVRDGARVETQKVIIQHDALEAANLLNRQEAVEKAQQALDTTVPINDLWDDLRGREATFTGPTVDGVVFASEVSLEEVITAKAEPSRTDCDLVEDAQTYIRSEYARQGDEYWSHQTNLAVPPETILHVRFGVHGDHFEAESHVEGTLRLTRRNEWVVDETNTQTVDKAARAHERRHERIR